ncbi:4-hydroxy-3-methylbut-2-enyl diphosphate reductase [Campylobacter concisus]|uniref:4-hydroxy-3-methylbut-2-enyl diphosphate reductase n=1 Tax=Campylobacter concisus TaxID=199 RepID=A0A1Y5NDF2_9BACT|nr:4-hydroxy-3-methylbut-2-enyl diphosphate reductase [Campylobacter concisus]
MCKARIFTHFLSFLMSGFYKILANKALDESLMIALKFRDFLSL